MKTRRNDPPGWPVIRPVTSGCYGHGLRKSLVRCVLAVSLILSVGQMKLVGQPTMLQQPADLTLSLAAKAELVGTASSASPPLTYQWRFKGEPVAGHAQVRLVIPAVALEHDGGYDVVATDSSGSVTSRVARLTVDPTFVVARDGPIVTDSEGTLGYGWADYDEEGHIDLLVANSATEQAGRYTAVLATATGTNVYAACVRVDTQFTRIKSGALVEDQGNSYVPVWGDYDGDGYVDLFVANGGNEGPPLQFIYRNNGDGTFSRMTAAEVGELANDKVQSAQGAGRTLITMEISICSSDPRKKTAPADFTSTKAMASSRW